MRLSKNPDVRSVTGQNLTQRTKLGSIGILDIPRADSDHDRIPASDFAGGVGHWFQGASGGCLGMATFNGVLLSGFQEDS